MKISVVIAAYNADKYIGETLRSVMDQTIHPYEIIVVDDGSTDSTSQSVSAFRNIRYIRQSRKGAAGALNTGVEASQGDFLAFLDADDLWTPDKLRLQCQAFQNDTALDMVFGMVQQFLSPELTESERNEIEFDARPMAGIHKSSLLIKKESFLSVGSLDEQLKSVEFLDWYTKAREYGLKETLITNVLARRRIHKTNMSRANKELRKEFPHVLKKALDRRRSHTHE